MKLSFHVGIMWRVVYRRLKPIGVLSARNQNRLCKRIIKQKTVFPYDKISRDLSMFFVEKLKGNVPINELRFLSVRFHEDTSAADEMRISLGQNHLHCIRSEKGYKTKHPFLLAGNPHIFNRSKGAMKIRKNENPPR